MTNTLLRGLVLVALAAISTNAAAYDETTHEWMTERAYQRSILADNSGLLESIGAQDPRLVSSLYPASDHASLSIPDLVSFGVRHEDSGIRPLNHFFDFQHNGRAL